VVVPAEEHIHVHLTHQHQQVVEELVKVCHQDRQDQVVEQMEQQTLEVELVL
tara:strand:+ start:212 stop:367 length:156 start_codon:yes stop_codon:yes gene_type:complete